MSISLQETHRISQISMTEHKTYANKGLIDKLSFKSINDFFLFPFYDELLQVTKLNSLFSILMIFSFIIQAVKTFLSFSNIAFLDFFSNFNFNIRYETILFPVFYFILDISYFIGVILQYRIKRMFSYRQLYISSLILSFFNVIFYIPTCGACGYSVIKINQFFVSNKTKEFSSRKKFTKKETPTKYWCFPNFIIDNYDFCNEKQQFSLNNKFNTTLDNLQNLIMINDSIRKDNYSNNYDKNKLNSKYYIKDNIIQNITQKNSLNKKYNPNSKRKKNSHIKNVKFKIKNEKHSNSEYKIKTAKLHRDPILKKLLGVTNYFIKNHDNKENEGFLSNSEFSKYLFSLIFTLFESLILTVQIVYHFHFISESPYLDRSIFSMWDCKVFIYYVFLIGICQFFSQILTLFPHWCTIFYHFIVLFIDIMILYYTFFQPFIKVSMNSFFQTLLLYNFINNLLIIIWMFKPLKIIVSIIYLLVISMIPFFIIFYFINKKIISVVNERLSPLKIAEDDTMSYEDFDEVPDKNSKKLKKAKNKQVQLFQLNDFEKQDLFNNLIFQSVDHALLYFRVGVSCSSPLFIDFSFMQFMKEAYGQIPIQLEILRFSALFPSQNTFFNYNLNIFSKREDFLSVYQQCVLYQLHKINNIRQSNFSKEIQNELAILDQMSDESISAIRGFWAEILQTKYGFKMSSLGFIRKMTLNTKTCYIDAITKYPNSIQILNSYCRFLCESCGDYIECVQIGQRIKLIEQGKYVNSDFCFHSFVNVFPQYLKRKILNEKGSFIVTNDSISSQSLSSLSSSRVSASFDDMTDLQKVNLKSIEVKQEDYKKMKTDDFEHLIEHENFESLISTLFKNGKARLSIQQIVDRSHNNSLIIALLISFVQTLSFILIMFFEFQFISHYQKPIQLIESSARTSKIIFSLQYCSLIAGIQYLTEKYDINISLQMIEHINIEEENLPNFSCTFIDPMVSLNRMTKSIGSNIDKEMKFIMNNPEDHEREMMIYSYLNNSINDSSGVFIYKFIDKSHSVYKMPLKNGLEYFRALSDRLAYEHHVEEKKESPNLKQFNDVYFELLLNSLTISEPFFVLFNEISENGIRLMKRNEHKLSNVASSILTVSLLVFLIARFFSYYNIKKLLKDAASIVNKVKNEDIDETMNPIFLKSQRKIKVHSINNHSIYESSPATVLYPIITFFSVVNVIGIFGISVFNVRSSFIFIENAQKWENKAASRFLCLTKMINCLISEHLGLPDITVFDKLRQSSTEMLDLSTKLDLSIIAKGKDLNKFYFTVNEDVMTEKMNLANYLDCISIENKVNMGILYYQLIENSIQSDNLLESPEFITLLFIIDKYLYRDLPKFQDKISETALAVVDKQKRNIFIICIAGVGVSLIYFVIELFIIQNISFCYNAFKQLIMVLPPSSFITNSHLINYLTESFGKPNLIDIAPRNLSDEEILINSVDEGVILIDKSMIIQSVNPAVQRMTGFLSDQLLGQNLLFLIPLTSRHIESVISFEKVPFYQRLNEIISHTGDNVAELNTKVLTDKGEEILVRTTIIGIVHNKEFKWASIVLNDISNEVKLKKKLKEAKKKNEILLNYLLPQPVLEKIRSTKRPAYYVSNQATLINIQLDGFDDFFCTMSHKAMMSSIQNIYSKIDHLIHPKVKANQFLYNKTKKKEKPHKNKTIQNPKIRFHSNSNSNSNYEENLSKKSASNHSQKFSSKSNNSFNENDDFEDDENCDFNCIYNIRNDNDLFISIAGLFDSKNDFKKQATSCVCYALKVRDIIEKAAYEDQFNMHVHTKLTVCMGGPIIGYVENPEYPEFKFLTNLLKETDKIKSITEYDAVYINENLYKYLDKEKFEIEEKTVLNNFVYQKIYVVHRRLKGKAKNKITGKIGHNVFCISTDSEN